MNINMYIMVDNIFTMNNSASTGVMMCFDCRSFFSKFRSSVLSALYLRTKRQSCKLSLELIFVITLTRSDVSETSLHAELSINEYSSVRLSNGHPTSIMRLINVFGC